MTGVKTPYLKARDPETIDKMVTDYLPLVRYIVGRLPLQLPHFMDEEDLISVGVLGLIHAAKTYNPDFGASFKTYAYTNIRGAILDELRRHDPIPRSMRDRMKKVEEAKQNGEWEKAYSSREPVDIPEDLKNALRAVPEALKNFTAFPPSARFMYIHWINEAKREDTRVRRIHTVVVRSMQNKKPGIDLRVINP